MSWSIATALFDLRQSYAGFDGRGFYFLKTDKLYMSPGGVRGLHRRLNGDAVIARRSLISGR